MSNPTSELEPTQIYGTTSVPLPRVAIKFCVRCKWNLRAAYYAQELLQTFSLTLGEVALVPSSSGTFVVTLSLPQRPVVAAYATDKPLPVAEAVGGEREASIDDGARGGEGVREFVLWDRKLDGGFPETKELKRRVRDLVEPGRGLGHVDRDYGGDGQKGGSRGKGQGGENVEDGKEGEGKGREEKGGEVTDRVEKGRGREKDGKNEKEPSARCEDCA